MTESDRQPERVVPGEEVRRRFRWETAADETLELYRECAAGGVDGGRLSSRPA